MKVYRDGDKIGHATNVSPPKFKGQLFLCREGTSPQNVKETLRSLVDLKSLQEIDIESLTPDWLASLKLPLQISNAPNVALDDETVNVHTVKYVDLNSDDADGCILFFGVVMVVGDLLGTDIYFTAFWVVLMVLILVYRHLVGSMHDYATHHIVKK